MMNYVPVRNLVSHSEGRIRLRLFEIKEMKEIFIPQREALKIRG
jgi:hypothetical protein